MQPDFMKMAQQSQAAPQQQAAPQATEEQLTEVTDGFKEAGMPAGTDAESAKQRILFVLEQAGVLEKLQPQQLQDLTQKINEFVKLQKQEICRQFKAIQYFKYYNK